MDERISNLKTLIQDLNQGVREKRLYEFVGESLRETNELPIQIRRALAFKNIMEKTPQIVLPYELITGTMLGQCPLKKDVLTIEEQRNQSIHRLDEYLKQKEKDSASHVIQYSEGHIKSFDESFSSKKSRWSLMARVYQDSSIPYNELQDRIEEMKERYKDANIEPYEIGRELERLFKIEYKGENKRLYDDLPYFIGNHISLNYERILHVGLGETQKQIENYLENVNDENREYYEAALITIRATIDFIRRYAQTVRNESENLITTIERKKSWIRWQTCWNIFL